MDRERFRIRFCKAGDLRFLSHRDLARVWERWLRRAGVRLSMSEGFHPKPRINFPSALGLGIVGLDELVEIDVAEQRSVESLSAALAAAAPPELTIHSIELLPTGGAKAQVEHVVYEQAIPPERCAAAAERIGWLLSQESYVVERPDRKTPLELRRSIAGLALTGERVSMRLAVDPEGTARPREVLAALGLGDLAEGGEPLVRTAVEIAS